MKALRILVVEDKAVIGMLLAEMLEEMGHAVCAIEATEADVVIAAGRCKPDLMIVDAWLGDGSGVSAVEKIGRTGSIPHPFVSGDISRLMALRPDAVVVKSLFVKLISLGPSKVRSTPHLDGVTARPGALDFAMPMAVIIGTGPCAMNRIPFKNGAAEAASPRALKAEIAGQ